MEDAALGMIGFLCQQSLEEGAKTPSILSSGSKGACNPHQVRSKNLLAKSKATATWQKVFSTTAK